MRMILYVRSNCPACREAKETLTNAGIEYREIDTETEYGHAALIADTGRLGIVPRAMPVLICGDDIWTGYDCVVAIEEGEVE